MFKNCHDYMHVALMTFFSNSFVLYNITSFSLKRVGIRESPHLE